MNIEVKDKYRFSPLSEPIPITEQNWPEGTLPFVHTRTMTFMHEKFIRDCIEGILMQKTTFPVKVLIHDDASTDKTSEIIREYENRYPRLIKAYYQRENTYSKPDKNNQRKDFFSWRIGKYEAICEGDDYWTDPLKLQKQLDFLENNPDCSLCFHTSKTIRNNNIDDFSISKPKKIPPDNKFEMKHVILGGGGFMATNSMVFLTNYIKERPEWMNSQSVGDYSLMLLLAYNGKLGFIDDVMSVYRYMSTSTSWSVSMLSWEKQKENYFRILSTLKDFDKWSSNKYHYFVMKKQVIMGFNYYKISFIKYLKKIIKL